MKAMIYSFDEFELDGDRLELRRDGVVLKVDRIVLRVLVVLVRNAGRLVTKDELVDEVWDGRATTDNVLTVSMARLRKALDGRRGKHEYVATIYGLGYRFVRPVLAQPAANGPHPVLPGLAIAVDVEPPLVGRDAVLAELSRGAARARLGRGRLYALAGEAGVGKTSVVQALCDALADGSCRIAWGFCRESGTPPPLDPWLQLLRTLFASEPAETWKQALGPLAEGLSAMLAAGDARDGAPPSPRSIEPVARAFVRAAELTPWVLVLEDLHRADAASLEVLSVLVDEIGRSRLLVVATLREQGGSRPQRPSTALPYVLGHSNSERIALKRLPRSEVQRYVAACVGDAEGRFGEAVFAKSQGNPFLMKELIAQLRREGAREPGELRLSGAVLDVVRRRVADLPEGTRALLRAAAVAGTRFELPILQAVTGQSFADLARALDDAIAADLVVATPDSPTAFSFEHDLIRSALYEELPLADRRHRHLATARAIEERATESHVSAPAGELADHFYAAMPETDLAKTITWCERAAKIAGGSFAHTDAARHMRQALHALSLLPGAAPDKRADLLLGLALFTRGSAPELSRASLEELVRIARELGDARRLVRGAMMYHVHPDLVSLPGGSEALEHALTLLSPSDLGLRATALASLATATPRCYSAAASRAAIDEAEQLARAAPHDECLQVVLTCKLFTHGDASDATVAALSAELTRITRCRPQRTPVVPLFIMLHQAVRALQHGQRDVARAAIERGLARARLVRHPELRWHFERFEALTLLDEGRCSEGREALHRLHRQIAQRPILGCAAFCAFDRAVVLPEVGIPLQVDDALRSALTPQPSDAPGVWALKVRALASAGLREEASGALALVPAAALDDLPHDSQYVGTLGHLARAALALDAHAHAAAAYRLLAAHDGLYAGHASYHCEGPVPLVRGLLAQRLGFADRARNLLELGLRRSDRTGLPRCAIEARLELAACVRDHEGDGLGRASELLREAHGLAIQHGYDGLARRTRQLAGTILGSESLGGAWSRTPTRSEPRPPEA